MNARSRAFLTVLLVLVTLLSACDVLQTPTLEPLSPGAASTYAVQTMAAEPNLALLLATATPGEIPAEATALPPPTDSPVPMLTPVSVSTSSYVIAVPIGAATQNAQAEGQPVAASAGECDNAAEFVQDVTIPDDMVVKPGQELTKIWQLKNNGTCTWTDDYSLVLIWGEAMGTTPPVPLNKIVEPGTVADIALDIVTPYFPSCYQGNWMLQTADGERFGTGEHGKNPFWVSVTVDVPGLPNFFKVG